MKIFNKFKIMIINLLKISLEKVVPRFYYKKILKKKNLKKMNNPLETAIHFPGVQKHFHLTKSLWKMNSLIIKKIIKKKH